MLDHKILLLLLHYDPKLGVFTTRHHKVNKPVGCFVTHSVKRTRYLRIRMHGTEYRGNRLAVFYMTGDWPKARLYSVDGNAGNVIYDNITLVPRKTIGPAPRSAVNTAKSRGVTVLSKRVSQERKSAAYKQTLADKYFAAWDDDELDD